MQSTGARIAVAIAGAAAVVVLFLVLRDDGGDDESTTAATMPPPSEESPAESRKPAKEPKSKPEETVTEIQVRGGQPVGGVAEIEAQNGEKVRLVVSSPDTTEHVHVHGYDLFADLAPGKPANLSFDATIDGVFEVELEESATHLAELTVEP
jgi:FtsP/CotA-like multicopper oxidase with cupredoxin domain